MSNKTILSVAVAAMAFSFGAKAQTNVQTFYDFGKDRNYVTTTFEMFKGDKFGDTFFFIDHYYNSTDKNLRQYGVTGNALGGAVNGSYFEIERGINFWQESSLKDLSAQWGLNNLFGVNGLTFKGFADLWGNNTLWADGETTKWTFLTEPQLWMNLGSLFDGHLDIGGELELSYNFAGNKGFMCNPCAGLRWSF